MEMNVTVGLVVLLAVFIVMLLKKVAFEWTLAASFAAAGFASKIVAGAGIGAAIVNAAGGVLVATVIVGIFKIFWDFSDGKDKSETHRRGARIADAKELAKVTASPDKKVVQARLGDVPVPVNLEPQHFLFAGGTGAGKSLAFNQLMTSARARNHKAIIVDLNGSALSRFYKNGDLILNPFDARSVAWSAFAEIEGAWDVDSLTKSLIPDGHGSSAEWNLFAQNVVSAVIRNLHSQGKGTNQNLYNALIIQSQKDLSELVVGTPAARLFEKGAEKMLQSVLGIISSYFSAYQYLPGQAGADGFSIKKWMQEPGDGWLFINVKDAQLDSLKPLIAGWLDVAIKALLSGKSSGQTSSGRTWFFMDEMASYGRIQSVDALLTKARKFGGVATVGLQSISQLRSIYGRDDAQTILSCFSSQLFLRQVDAETAEYASKQLADAEIRRTTKSETVSEKNSTTTNEQITVKRLVMPSELQNLPDRIGYINFAGEFPIAKVTVPIPADAPEKASNFEPA